MTLASGHSLRADAIASNADVMHSYRDLLAGGRGRKMARRLGRKKWSPSLFVLHFGVEGHYPGVPHHMILFAERYRELLDDIYRRGVLSDDFAIYLHYPSATDPSLAPPGRSTFYALVPAPHLGHAAIDWNSEGETLARKIIAKLEERLLPDLSQRIVTRFHYTPRDFSADLAAHHGSAFSLLPSLTQSAWFRTHNRDDAIDNLYFVGAGTHPGAGIPGVVASAKATAGLMLDAAALAVAD